MAEYNIEEIKNSLTNIQIMSLVSELGGEPQETDNAVICKTICHNGSQGDGSHKLYYYNNTHLFHCYTGCAEPSFDIFELVRKVKTIDSQKEWSLPQAINFVAKFFGISKNNQDFFNEQLELQDWKIFERYKDIDLNSKEQIIELKTFDDKILKNFPQPRIEDWENDGIEKRVMDEFGIRYDPLSHGIIIPHYNKDSKLIGIRERTLIKENEIYGKYLPAVINGKMYNHPLGFNLYGLDRNQFNIRIFKTAIVFEGEKSVLQYGSMFGSGNNIAVACCGSNLINYQMKLLKDVGAEEIIVAFDRQFKEIGDEEYQRWVKKLKELSKKYKNYVKVSFIFDTKGLLGYKDSPVDKGRDVFLQLFKDRLDKNGYEM